MDESRFLCSAAVGSSLDVKSGRSDPSGGFYVQKHFFGENPL